VIYGGTPSGILAACSASNQGSSVALILGTSPLGGMPAQGLGATDGSIHGTYGGMTLSFFNRVGRKYNLPFTEKFEPHVAELVFREMLDESKVKIIHGTLKTVHRSGKKISAIALDTHEIVPGKTFIDASYEGDFLAAAGAKWTIGRESRSQYGESAAGYNISPDTIPISAYESPGKLYPSVLPAPKRAVGAADNCVQAYAYRLCLSNEAGNKRSWVKPANYNPDLYIPLKTNYTSFDPTPTQNHKFDLNSNIFPVRWDYAELDTVKRAAIELHHRDWIKGWLYFLSSDPRIPAHYRDEVNSYGLAKDEFVNTENFPVQLYIREARRLVGRQVMTVKDLQTNITKTDSIGIGSYDIDIHPVALYPDGVKHVNQEGTFLPRNLAQVPPYEIPYKALQPNVDELDNLLVSVCISCSHVAWGSIRTETHLMIIGEGAGVAASLAAKSNVPVSNVHVAELQRALEEQGVVLHYTA